MTDFQIGWLATAFTLLYAIVGVPLGRLSDRANRPRILSFGVMLWSLLTAASGIAWSYTSLFITRLGVGVGEATCAPAANSLIGDLYPPARRGRALSLFMLGVPCGGFLGFFVSGQLAASYGWRMAFYVACLPGVILAALALAIIDAPRGASESSPLAGRPHDGSPYRSVLRILTIQWIIITGALFNFMMYATSTFLPTYLSRFHSLDLKQATALTAIIFCAAGVPGLLLGGWLVDRCASARSGGRLLVPATAMLLAAVAFFLALNITAGRSAPFGLLMGAGCFFANFYYAGVYAAIQDVVPPVLRGTAMSLYFFAMYLLGGSFGPLLTGKFSDYFARDAMTRAGASALNEQFRAIGLHSAMYVIPWCSLLLALVLLGASRTISGDMTRLQHWISFSGTSLPPK